MKKSRELSVVSHREDISRADLDRLAKGGCTFGRRDKTLIVAMLSFYKHYLTDEGWTAGMDDPIIRPLARFCLGWMAQQDWEQSQRAGWGEKAQGKPHPRRKENSAQAAGRLLADHDEPPPPPPEQASNNLRQLRQVVAGLLLAIVLASGGCLLTRWTTPPPKTGIIKNPTPAKPLPQKRKP